MNTFITPDAPKGSAASICKTHNRMFMVRDPQTWHGWRPAGANRTNAGNAAARDEHYGHAHGIFRETRDLRQEGKLLGNMADAASNEGNHTQAEAQFQHALEQHRQAKNRRSEGITLGDLGLLYLRTGRVEAARQTIAEGMATLKASGDGMMQAALKREWDALGGPT